MEANKCFTHNFHHVCFLVYICKYIPICTYASNSIYFFITSSHIGYSNIYLSIGNNSKGCYCSSNKQKLTWTNYTLVRLLISKGIFTKSINSVLYTCTSLFGRSRSTPRYWNAYDLCWHNVLFIPVYVSRLTAHYQLFPCPSHHCVYVSLTMCWQVHQQFTFNFMWFYSHLYTVYICILDMSLLSSGRLYILD